MKKKIFFHLNQHFDTSKQFSRASIIFDYIDKKSLNLNSEFSIINLRLTFDLRPVNIIGNVLYWGDDSLCFFHLK